jgi:hypothetical protein
VKQGDLAGSLEARSEGLHASDFKSAIVPGLAAVISWTLSSSHRQYVGKTYEGDDPSIIAPL